MRTDTVTALADAEPRVYWLDTPSRPPSRPALQAPARTDLAVVGGGYTGLWTALLAKERDPGRDVVLLEGDRIGWAASGRNGGFCAASLTHGEANGRGALPARVPDPGADGPGEPRRHRGDGGPLRDRLRLPNAPGAGRRDRRLPGGRAAGARRRRRGRLPGPGRRPRGGRLADVPRGALGPRGAPPWSTPPRLAWGLAAAAEAAGVRMLEHTPVVDVRAVRRRAGAAHRARPHGARRPGGAGHQRVPVAAAAAAAAHGAGVRLRPGDRAALAGQQRDAIGWRHRQGIGDRREPVPLLPAHRRQPDPVGRVRRHLPLRPQGPPRLRPAARRRSHTLAGPLLRDVPAAGGAALHPPVGRRDRHVHPVLRVLRHGVSPGARPTRSATPGSASARPGSAPT